MSLAFCVAANWADFLQQFQIIGLFPNLRPHTNYISKFYHPSSATNRTDDLTGSEPATKWRE